VNGPLSCFEVLDMICKTFGLQIYTDQNIIWIVRLPDMLNAPLSAENYNSGVMNQIVLQANERSIAYNSNDAKAVNANARNILFPAIKSVEYDIKYKTINIVENFQWEVFSSGVFDKWTNNNGVIASRSGNGGLDDPYRLRINYQGDFNISDGKTVSQFYNDNNKLTARIGDVIDFSFKYDLNNVRQGYVSIAVVTPDPELPLEYIVLSLDSGGSWNDVSFDYGVFGAIPLTRSGTRRSGSIDFRSAPLPRKIGNIEYPDQEYRIYVGFFAPTDVILTNPDPGGQYIDIYPVKLGKISGMPTGKNVKSENQGRYSKVVSKSDVWFADTGLSLISNTIAVDASGTPAQNWFTAQDANKQTIQRRTADGVINQYARTIYGWESDVRSNSINYNNTYNIFGKDGKKYIIMQDSYSIRSAEHRTSMQEVLPDGTAETTYTEVDITDQNN